MSHPLRIVFAGTPEFAADHLSALLMSHHHVVAVYTQPDRPAGRGKKVHPSAVKVLALQHGLPIFQPLSLKPTEQVDILRQHDADVMVVVAYGLILPESILSVPRYGCLNVHGSLLPRWRGAAPIQRALWAGDTETGVTVMQMDKGLDTGNMLYKAVLAIEPTDNSASLYQKLAVLGPQALLHTLDHLHSLKAEPQDNTLATYATKLDKEEACINWHLDAEQLARQVRAFNPWPVSWFQHKGLAIKVWAADVPDRESTQLAPGTIISATKEGIVISTGKGVLRLLSLQFPGKRALDAAAIINGHANWFVPGEQLCTDALDA